MAHKTKLVSVVIPTYNRVKSVIKAIETVKTQTYKNLELIVCDDGSTDDTKKMVLKLANDDKRIKYISLKHTGTPAIPRNEGIKISKGEYIAFLDSDDLWTPNKLEDQIEIITKNKVNLVCSNAIALNPEGSRVYFPKQKSTEISLNLLIDENIIITSTVLIKKKLLNTISLFPTGKEFTAIEDYLLWLRVVSCEKAFFLNKNLISYSDNPSLTIRKNWVDKDMQQSVVMKNFYEWAIKSKIPKISKVTLDKVKKIAITPIVSVIMPTYNVDKNSLHNSIQSILNQSYSNLELLLIDDGSNPPVNNMLSSIKDKRLKLLTRKHKGVASSLNYGLKLAKGKYIARMDSDDVAYPERIMIQKKFLDNHPDIAVVGSWLKVVGKQEYIRKTSDNSELIKSEMLFRCPIAHPTVMFRKEIFKKITPYNNKYEHAEDYELWSRVMEKFAMANIQKILLAYTVHDGQVGSKYMYDQNLKSDEIRKKIIKRIMPKVTNKNMMLHNQLSRYEYKMATNIDYIKWIFTIISENQKTKILDQANLKKVLCREVKSLLFYSSIINRIILSFYMAMYPIGRYFLTETYEAYKKSR